MNFKTNTPLTMEGSITNQLAKQSAPKNKVEFFKVTTEDGVEMDGWMKKPDNFDRTKKYPVVFYVYGEPASATATDVWGAGNNRLYQGNMAKDGYIYISMDNRGAPVPKGRNWRKAIYKNIGQLNIRDQAMAAKKLLETNSFMDKDRVAVWGWSGGGSSTLNLMFQYPEIYKTGISIAPVANQLTYDNIYQERYMGTPFPSTEAYVKGSPISYAKNLKGNLLLVHGTGDDNVHYQNAEMLINELIKYQKPFQMMSYPNRSHSINEGEGTSSHLSLIYTKYLKEHCPPGGR
jgi:dipeptidyl-peptidase-4